jgi:hypothetical protein
MVLSSMRVRNPFPCLLIAGLLTTGTASAQAPATSPASTPVNSQGGPILPLRLRNVKTVYIASFGVEQGAEMIRAKVLAGLVKSRKLEVVESEGDADAVLTGIGQVSTQPDPLTGKDHADATVRLVGRIDRRILWVDEASDALLTLRNATSSAADGIVKKLLAAIEKDKH